MTDLPTPDAEPTREQLARAREEREETARERAERAAQAREDEAQEVWDQGQVAARRAEAMGDRVEEEPETGMDSGSAQE